MSLFRCRCEEERFRGAKVVRRAAFASVGAGDIDAYSGSPPPYVSGHRASWREAEGSMEIRFLLSGQPAERASSRGCAAQQETTPLARIPPIPVPNHPQRGCPTASSGTRQTLGEWTADSPEHGVSKARRRSPAGTTWPRRWNGRRVCRYALCFPGVSARTVGRGPPHRFSQKLRGPLRSTCSGKRR